jgi:predicted ATPase
MALLIIGTYRDTDLENNHPLLETLHGLRRSPGYQVFALARLSQIEVEQMLINIWGQSLPPLLVEKIYRVTEGNPFYVEEVAKGLVDDGTVKWRDGV